MMAPLLALLAANGAPGEARNPILWADVPDISVVRAKGAYYMSSTTMHMAPGLPIMKSSDLVNWKLVGYAYRTLGDNDALNLRNGRDAYGAGSWASSLRFHKGTFYVSTFSSTTGKTHIFTTKNPERGPWKEVAFAPSFHDHSLFFDDDGRVYLVYGAGDIRLVELKEDLSGVKPGGVHKTIIPNATAVAGGEPGLPAEGSQLFKVNGKYYLCNITWPRGDIRTQIVHRADRIDGPYEGRVMFKDRGIAQGSMVDTPDGRWFAYLFRDNGAVGRIPWLVPMKWVDGWPVAGIEGKAPDILDLPGARVGVSGIVTSDEFKGKTLPLAWQWNHNPDDAHWSLTARPGFLRITPSHVAAEVVQARNTLTQRTFGPTSAATTCLHLDGLREGDFAGLVALQKKYGFVAATKAGGKNFLVMVGAGSGKPQELERVEFSGRQVYLRVECDFRDHKDEARFAYSLDGKQWTAIGKPLRMVYDLPHFMGYRFGLFDFATQQPGGHADFDFFRIDDKLTLF
jgi:beta-xylosidase